MSNDLTSEFMYKVKGITTVSRTEFSVSSYCLITTVADDTLALMCPSEVYDVPFRGIHPEPPTFTYIPLPEPAVDEAAGYVVTEGYHFWCQASSLRKPAVPEVQLPFPQQHHQQKTTTEKTLSAPAQAVFGHENLFTEVTGLAGSYWTSLGGVRGGRSHVLSRHGSYSREYLVCEHMSLRKPGQTYNAVVTNTKKRLDSHVYTAQNPKSSYQKDARPFGTLRREMLADRKSGICGSLEWLGRRGYDGETGSMS
ncbi:hypothetical protein BJ170DRAFT_593201 [Xylariales sp. AK1849]|nr:hypothetical protein BJ170DRAFT_593201 [Xylariales sp. AK1849]